MIAKVLNKQKIEDVVYVYKDVTPNLPKIFLAGPTKRDWYHDKDSWRYEACNLLDENGFNGYVFIPENDKKDTFDSSEEGLKSQHVWEWTCMNESDAIMFWIPRDIENDMPAFTTNVEFGYCLGSFLRKNVIYGRPDTAEKCEYLDDLYNATIGKRYNNTLEKTVCAAIHLIEERERKYERHLFENLRRSNRV